MIAWLTAAALAGECTENLTTPADALSVAWVSPLGRRVASRGYLTVVPSGALRSWVTAERPSLGRLLQAVGERRKEKDPKRRYKVVVFDVAAADLCRPLDDVAEGTVVAGVATCAANRSPRDAGDGCGSLVDNATGAASFPAYRVRWLEAARDGFCVLPAERFIQ